MKTKQFIQTKCGGRKGCSLPENEATDEAVYIVIDNRIVVALTSTQRAAKK